MKNTLTFLLVLFGFIASAQIPPGPLRWMEMAASVKAPASMWTLVWNDEFSGTTLNTNTWFSDNGPASCIDGNGDIQVYTNDAATFQVTNGYLRIIANVNTSGPTNFLTSGRLETEGINDCTEIIYTNQSLFTMTYGAIEWRAKIPQGIGAWPALWLEAYGSQNPNNPQLPFYGWFPNCGEIDVMENNGSSPNQTAQNLHYYGGSYQSSESVSDVTQWHTYRVEWYTNQFIWYVDGVAGSSTTNWTAPPGFSYPAPFDARGGGFIVVMDLALGGSYTGSPSWSSVTNAVPFEMDVDYVRVYTGAPLPATTPVTSGLILSLPMTDGAGTNAMDLSGNNYNGQLAGTTAPTWYSIESTAGVQFNATNSSYMVVSNSASMLTTNLTFSFWAKNTNQYEQIIFGVRKNDTYESDVALTFGLGASYTRQTNNLSIDYYSPISPGFDQEVTAELRTTNQAISDGFWHHYAVTVNATNNTSSIYIDAISNAVTYDIQVGPLTAVNFGTNCYVANWNDASLGLTGLWNYNGVLSDFRIFNRVISAVEVTNLFFGGITNHNH